MHDRLYSTFESYLSGIGDFDSALEIGVEPGQDALLSSPAFETADEKVGLDLEHSQHPDPDIDVIQGNANDMQMFEASRFDCIVSNAVLEHDPYFWEMLAEIRRVAADGAVIVLGGPAFTRTGERDGLLPSTITEKNRMIRLCHEVVCRVYYSFKEERPRRTWTYAYHLTPNDYYRFSEFAVRDVWMNGLSDVELTELLNPPRIVAKGIMRG